jgi:hypothetical protein
MFWTGRAEDVPVAAKVDLSNYNPEGLGYDASTGELLVISDDGREEVDGVELRDKARADRYFRTVRIRVDP